MKKLVMAVFAVALFASAASAYQFTIGGQVGFNYAKVEAGGASDNETTYTIAPEFGYIVDEDTNVGIGLSYSKSYEDFASYGGPASVETKTFGGYLFGERAVINPGPFKVFLRADIGYNNSKLEGIDEKLNTFAIGIVPNVQYALNDRLTLIVSSDVLRLGLEYSKIDDTEITNFGFNVGNGNIASVGLKYAF